MRKFILFLVGFYAVWALRVVILSPLLAQIQSPWVGQIASDGVRVLVWMLPVFLYVRFVERVPALTYLRMDSFGQRWGIWLGAGVVFVLAVFGGQALLTGSASLQRPENGAAWALMLFKLPAAPLVEEIFFRGFVQRTLTVRFPFWAGNLLTALLFTAAHWVGWGYFFGWQTILALSPGVFAIGWVLGFITHKTGSTWPGVIVHIFNNFVSWIVLFG